jgi:3'-5' exoribonuclease
MMLGTLKNGDQLDGLDVLIEKRSEAKTKNGKPYLRLTIRDKTGSLECVFWGYDPARHTHPEGSCCKVFGAMSSYNDTLQVTLADMQDSAAQAEAFAKSTRFDVEVMWTELAERIEAMTEPLTKFVAEEILLGDAMMEAFKKAPAAKTVHNAWYGGLVEHVWSLCRVADGVIAHYQKTYCEKISKDKVIFGLMLHDAGKVVEYDYSHPAFAYTAVGQLTPHIVLGPAWVYEKANKWRTDSLRAGALTREDFKLERAHLMHILAAHHGKIEWGSPVAPATMEALLVHQLDLLDSRVLHALDYITGKAGPTPGFSERSYFEKTAYLQYR